MLREYANSNPELSLKEIGRVFNISESRVWRILHRNKCASIKVKNEKAEG